MVMSDGIVAEGIRGISEYGPVWIILLFIIVAGVVMGLALIPTIKGWVETKAKREETEQQIAKEREDRKREEMIQRAEKDGQMITLMSESNRVIERNSSAFRQVTTSIDGLNEQTHQLRTQLGAEVKDLSDSVKELHESVSDLRVDVAGLKGGN